MDCGEKKPSGTPLYMGRRCRDCYSRFRMDVYAKQERELYVYVDCRLDDGRPFYVGKGDVRRVRSDSRNKLHTRIAAKHGCIRIVSAPIDNKKEAFHLERMLIRKLKTREYQGGANFTDGGDGGGPGFVPTEEQRNKMSIASLGRPKSMEHRANISAGQKGRLVSLKCRAAVALSNSMRVHSSETRAKLSAASRRRTVTTISEETRAKISAATVGRPAWNRGLSPNNVTRAKMSVSAKRRWAAWADRKAASSGDAVYGDKKSEGGNRQPVDVAGDHDALNEDHPAERLETASESESSPVKTRAG